MSNGSRGLGVAITLALAGAGLTFLVAVMDESRNFDNPMPVFVVMAAAAMYFGLIRGPVGKAIAAMLSGETASDEHLAMRVEDLEARVAELSMEQSRMMELEGRVDFAERLLAGTQQRGGTNGTTQQ